MIIIICMDNKGINDGNDLLVASAKCDVICMSIEIIKYDVIGKMDYPRLCRILLK